MGHAVLQTIPEGFTSAVEILNLFPKDLLAELCHEVIAFLQFSKGLVSATQYLDKLHDVDVQSSEQAVQGAINALTFLFRSAARAKVLPDDLVKELRQSLVWSDSCIDVIKEVWTEKGKSVCSAQGVNQLLSVGQLVDMQWKLGVAMTSDVCRSLNSTFVMMSLKVADPSGQVTTKSLEMTVAEFKNFSKQIREMAAMLEMI
ncbi:COMM domain-containing protein 6-like [Patiria miniata]|uniref:COMM domain-containing protein 6 n=1 Tax=Patiria miniata TaxID=46514 RepID=A0A913ZXW9_PATMI|nr:COMM domain-containing protein 6-like [Patiria miniata]